MTHPAEASDNVGWTRPQTIDLFSAQAPLKLELGGSLPGIVVEYETYGSLSAANDNVILVAHGLSADAHAAGYDAEAQAMGRHWRVDKPGWWDAVIGPGKALDTNRFFVVCSNVLGSCYGTSSSASINPETGEAYGLEFPMVTVSDWVHVEKALLDALGIRRLHTVVGGSLGGQQALEWALAYPDMVGRSAVLAASPRLSAQGLAFNAVSRHAILHDPDFNDGKYYGKTNVSTGLAVARMLGHITYLSDESMHQKFGRRRREVEAEQHGFGIEYEVESYLDHQAKSFTERFDANAYLYITRAMDYYDAAVRWGNGSLTEAAERIQSQMLIMSFSSDWLYPSEQCRQFAVSMINVGKSATYVDVDSLYGHDAFLVETDKVCPILKAFVEQ